MKKAELSMTVIISASIALLILVILSVLVLSSTSIFDREVNDCSAVEGAVCTVLQPGESCADYVEGLIRTHQRCPTQEQTCCMPATR